MSPVTDSAFLRAKQTVTVTIDFCNWLAGEHNTTVEQVTQGHIDLWQSTGPTTREHILRFIRWAIKAELVASDLEVTPHRRGTAPGCRSHSRTPSSNRSHTSRRFILATVSPRS